MTLLLYAVAEADVARRAARLADGAVALDLPPLRAICHHRLGAVVGERETAPAQTEPELKFYAEVVEGLMRAGAILPARFGTLAANEAEVREMLQTRSNELMRSLERVRDAVEFAVRGSRNFPARLDIRAGVARNGNGGAGTAYLQQRLAEGQVERRLVETVQTAGRGLVRETLSRPPRPLAVLVEADGADAFAARMDEHGLTLTGPWPPYSFVEAGP